MLSACYLTLGLVFLLLAIRNAEDAFFLYLLLAPFNYFYVWAFGWTVSWTSDGGVGEGVPPSVKYYKDVILLIIMLVWVIKRKRLIIRRRDLPVALLLGCFLAMSVPTFLLDGFSLGATALWQNVGTMFAYFAVKEMRWNEQRALKVLRWSITLGGGVAMLGVYQWLFGSAALFSYVSGDYLGMKRAISTLGSPNNLGVLLDFTLVLILAAWDDLAGWFRRAGLAAVLGGILFTISMTTYLVAILALLLWAAIRRRHKTSLALAVLLALAAVGGYQVGGLAVDRIRTVASGRDQSFGDRLEAWNRILRNGTPLNYLVGNGTGRGGSMTVAFQDKDNKLADNQYFAIYGQLGALGLAAFLLVMVRALNHRRPSPRMDLIRRAGAPVVCMYAVFFLTGNFLNVFPANLYFWSVLGAIMSRTAIPPAPRSVERQVAG